MSYFVRGCTLSVCHYYGNIINKVKPYPLYPLFFNLNVKCSSNSKSFCEEKYSFALDEDIKRYLNHLTDVYQNNEKVNTESINEILKLETVPVLLDRKIKIIENIRSLTSLVSEDKEIKNLVKEEELMYQQALVEIDQQILDILLRTVCHDQYDNVIMEIAAGVGGQEAMLFAMDLFNMYIHYLNYLGFRYEILEMTKSEKAGLRKSIILISDSRAFEKLTYEGGVHRVQRIPSTSKTGQMHTSTAIVTVTPEPREIDITIEQKDIKIETYRASGAGGQHVNTTDSAVRVTHIPTGISTTCQTDRSQQRNKSLALMKLRSLLYQNQMDKQMSFINKLRKKQMGGKLRNEKIRTYNFHQNRVTDHRIPNGTMHNLKDFMKDGVFLLQLQDKLLKNMQLQILLEFIKFVEREVKQH